MSIMDKIFGAPRPAAVAPQAPGVPTAPAVTNNLQTNPPIATAPATPGTAPNGTIPPGGAEAPDVKYAELWQPDKTAEQLATGPAPIDSDKLMAAAAKVDFSKVITPELLQKITAGGEEAANALVQAMNLTAQNVYGQSVVVTSRIVERAVQQAEERFQDRIPSILRSQGIKQRVFEENPAFSNPAYAPLIEAQVAQLASKYPKATQSELQGMAKEYLAGFAKAVSPPKADVSAPSATGKGEEDWDKWINS